MLVWFLVLAPVLVVEVFRSPMIDYRMVVAGAVIPLGEVALGGPLFLHTLAAPVVAMALVMAAWSGKRTTKRRWLGLPIGLFMHSLLDGVWLSTRLFRWPVGGWGFDGLSAPEVRRSVTFSLALDLVGVAVGLWAWKRYELDRVGNRKRLLSTGQLSRSAMPG